MRNRKFIYAALALLTLGFAACQQEEDFTPQGGNDEIRISFTSDAIQTRVNTLGTGDKWENGDQILVVNVANDMSATFTASVASESASWTQDKKLYWESDGSNTLLASYPAGSGYGSFTLPTDQNNELKLKSADYMNAYCVGSKSQGAVTFAMQHRMAMITATYDIKNEFAQGSALSKAEVYSTSSTATFDYTQEGIMSVDEESQWVSAYIRDGKFTAIVMPGEYKTGDELMRVTVDGATEPLIVKAKEDFTLGEGEHRAFTLSVGKEYIEAESMSVDELKAAISAKLAAGETDIRIKLAENADATMFSAITAALATTVDPSLDQYELVMNYSGTIDLTISGAKTVPECTFYVDEYVNENWRAGAALRSVTLTDATTIGESAFFSSAMTSFSAPNVIEIEGFALEGCMKLTDVYLPSLQTLGDAVFSDCYALKTISLPECIDLGNGVFNSCEALETVYAPKATNLGAIEFMMCTSLMKVTLGSVVSVNQLYESIDNGLFCLANDTKNIELVLSSEQKVMTFDNGTKYWTATETDYNGSDYHNNKSFIGYTFKSVTLQ